MVTVKEVNNDEKDGRTPTGYFPDKRRTSAGQAPDSKSGLYLMPNLTRSV